MDKLRLELALQNGMTVKQVDGKIIIEIDKSITKRDLWNGQIEMWLTEADKFETISSGYLRITKKDKLEYKAWRK